MAPTKLCDEIGIQPQFGGIHFSGRPHTVRSYDVDSEGLTKLRQTKCQRQNAQLNDKTWTEEFEKFPLGFICFSCTYHGLILLLLRDFGITRSLFLFIRILNVPRQRRLIGTFISHN